MTRLVRAIAALVVIAGVARAELVIVESSEPPPVRVTTGRFGMVQLTLANGLGVIIAPDTSATSVAIHLRYESGTASEGTREPGFTHLAEGLLGMVSSHRTDFVAQIEALGGWTTATAAVDHLGTTTQVPAHALERALWLEAERMAGLADGITAATLARAKARTQAAWRAAYADAPYALVERELAAALWTGRLAGYGAPVLGDGRAVDAATLVMIKAFVRRRVVPNNAMLVIAGKLDPDAARRLVERYFGWMPPREHVLRGESWLPMAARSEKTIKDVSTKVAVAYLGVTYGAELAIAAQLLAGDRDGRLQRRLVGRGLASDVRAELVRYKTGGAELRIHATPLPGIDPRRVASAIRVEAERLYDAVTDAEVTRAAALVELEFYLAAENPAVRAELLAASSYADARGPSILEWWPERLRKLRAKDMIMLFDTFDAPVTVIGREDLP